MKKLLPFLALYLSVCAFFSCQKTPSTSVVWTEGEACEDGKAIHEIVIMNPPRKAGWSIWFSASGGRYESVDSTAKFKIYGGSLCRMVPATQKKADSLVIKYKARPMERLGGEPQGIYLMTADGRTFDIPAKYNYLPAEKYNTFTYIPVKTEVWDMIPALKSVKPSEGETKVGDYTPEIVEGQLPGWYRITLDGNVKVEAADEDGAYYAQVTIDNLKRNAGSDTIPNCIIEDWPDMEYRGLMLDVSRNFTTKENVEKLLDMLAHYKVNKFHFHLSDDQGWRVEIDGLPELTTFGGHRGAPALTEDGSIAEINALRPSHNGHSDPFDLNFPGNGYYTKADFIEILQYAQQHHIHVIPEFDTPGHSRAAIKSMEKRYAETGDASCLLSDPAEFTTSDAVLQNSDNTINVALPSTYAFMAKVFDAVIAMYKEAGVPLEAIHFGGDEVSSDVWESFSACQKLMAENGWTDYGISLKEYFVSKVLDIAEERGIKIAGWEELTMNLTDETFARLKNLMYFTNIWDIRGTNIDLPYGLANQGINVVISNSENTYFDMAYNHSKREPGQTWAGFVDERRAFSELPYDVYRTVRWDDNAEIADISKADEGKIVLTHPENVIGVQGQLWCETVNGFDYVTYYLFPRALGVFERGWNAHPVWEKTTVSDDPAFTADFDHFYSVVQDHEVPYFKELGINYREY